MKLPSDKFFAGTEKVQHRPGKSLQLRGYPIMVESHCRYNLWNPNGRACNLGEQSNGQI